VRNEHHYRTAWTEKFLYCVLIGKVALDMFDFTKASVVDIFGIQQKPVPGKGATWQALLSKVPGQVKSNEARSADYPDHSLVAVAEADCLPRLHPRRPWAVLIDASRQLLL
jgi:hypothetical protein